MGINLSSGNVRMSEQLLNCPQVAAGFQHVACKRVSQHVRVHIIIKVAFQAEGFESQLDGSRSDTGASLT